MKITNISVIVLTKNEEAGLGNTLRHLQEFEDLVVVDSNSDDRTVDIAAEHGARVVNFDWNGQHPKKKQWSLENAGSRNDWVLLLDADEYPTSELMSELRRLSTTLTSTSCGAFDIRLSYRFAGKQLRFGHVVTKRSLLHKGRAHFPEVGDLDAPGIREVEGHYQPETTASIRSLKNRLIHDDRDPVSSWFARHNRYSDWEAHLRMNASLRKEVAKKRTRKGQIFDHVPLKPVFFFAYAYLLRAGFLDGQAGLDYAIALSTYYWQIGVKLRELRRERIGFAR